MTNDPAQDPRLPHPHPQQPWAGPGLPGGTSPVAPPLGIGLAVGALILGLLACGLPILPVPLDLVRQYVALPPALGGLVLAIGGCMGNRRGKPLAVAAAILCVLALILALIMIVGRAA